MTAACPCCGAALPGSVPVAAMMPHLPLTLAAIVGALACGDKMTAEELAAEIHADDPDGGPLWAAHGVRSAVGRQGASLHRFGWQIVSVLGRRGGYRLVTLQREAAIEMRPAVFADPARASAQVRLPDNDRGLGPGMPFVEIDLNVNGAGAVRREGAGK